MTTVDIDDPEAVVVQKTGKVTPTFRATRYRCACKKALQTLPEKAAYGVQPEILSGNEVRRDVGDLRHVGRCTESILSSCGEEN